MVQCIVSFHVNFIEGINSYSSIASLFAIFIKNSMLVHLLLLPSLVRHGPNSLLGPHSLSHARTTPVTALEYGGDLPRMYRARWVSEAASEEAQFGWASATGAVLGVSTACLGSVKVSSALTGIASSQPNYGDATTKYASALNGMLPSPGELLFAVAVTVDIAAVFSFVYLAVTLIAAGSSDSAETSGEDEACLLVEDNHVCGELSFDSTNGYACVESQGVWVCA